MVWRWARKYVTVWRLEGENGRFQRSPGKKTEVSKQDATQALGPVAVRDMSNVSSGAATVRIVVEYRPTSRR